MNKQLEQSLQKAIKIAESIQMKQVHQLMAFSNPPEFCKIVSRAFIWLFAGISPTIQCSKKYPNKPMTDDWKQSLKLIVADARKFLILLKQIRSYLAADQISAENIEFIKQTCMSRPQFQPQYLKPKSTLFYNLSLYMFAVIQYSDKWQEIQYKNKQNYKE